MNGKSAQMRSTVSLYSIARRM